ncbi:ABC transporter ATP-binding protein [Lachnoclostridium phytofermentans]|uniref:ABC transporter related n=1 Tax=Lachnoclostridium phytofermentans (strain ATCC 700394 / DSM 18823 / ISDg) TaxID=357809 RepID=A9KIR3_LACP7|nr:ATP-binding cassette domain-containing protein [Lachnoclostridium phytofermentans]ABX43926.1 ABC transporter related [Lachnoclostridium phytofermentans ISDg]
MIASNKVIQLKSVNKLYKKGNVIALNDVSCEICEGELVGVLGRNGAGKSTMFKIIAGVLSDYSGKCEVFGNQSNRGNANVVSYLPETRGLNGRKDALEHLVDMVSFKGIDRKKSKKNVLFWLEKFNMLDYQNSRIDSLSKGNQQKLQLITSIACNPKILILDEPFSGLDPITVDFFWKILLELKANGTTIIFSTHIFDDKMLECDKFIFIVKGEIKENGTLQQLNEKYPMVLELENDSLAIEMIKNKYGDENVKLANGVLFIYIENESQAREIFDILSDKFSKRFYIRYMSLGEIFRKVNGIKNE